MMHICTLNANGIQYIFRFEKINIFFINCGSRCDELLEGIWKVKRGLELKTEMLNVSATDSVKPKILFRLVSSFGLYLPLCQRVQQKLPL